MDNSRATQHGAVFIQISVPDLNQEKLLQFSLVETVGDAKRTVISLLDGQLKDWLNYGLYLPPANGKAGKFLQEERPLKDYPFQGSVGLLELKYKRRIYRPLQVNPGKMKKLHSKSNLRQFVEYVKTHDINRVTKWLNKGLDPNYYSKDAKASPLSQAALGPAPREMIMALVSGGAHLDFHCPDGMTSLHRAAAAGSFEGVKALLDLGQSPNARDQKGLTPLYHAVLHDPRSLCVERLLFDHSILGVTDDCGFQEIHHACRLGRAQHLELLLHYGADLNSQTPNNGNTPLHVCASLGQEPCARLLLFRGADRTLVNRAGHTAYQQAMLSNGAQLAGLIKSYRDQDVVPLRGSPKFNMKRRTSIPSLRAYMRSNSTGRLIDIPTGNSGGSTYSDTESFRTHSDLDPERTLEKPRRRHKSSKDLTNKEPVRGEATNQKAGSRHGLRGSFNEKTGGRGWFKTSSNHDSSESRGRALSGGGLSRSVCDLASLKEGRKEKRRKSRARGGGILVNWDQVETESLTSDASSSNKSKTLLRKKKNGMSESSGNLYRAQSRGSLMTLVDIDTSNLPRVVVLQRSQKGFGFVIRGMKAGNPVDFVPTDAFPALQYFDKIDRNSPAEKAGIKSGDYILEINGDSVISTPHEQVVRRIRKAGDTVALKVVTIDATKGEKPACSHVDPDSDMDVASVQSGSVCSSRSGQLTRTASVRSRVSRHMSPTELEEMHSRHGRPESSVFCTTFKPEVAPVVQKPLNDTEGMSKWACHRRTGSSMDGSDSGVSLTSNLQASPRPPVASEDYPMPPVCRLPVEMPAQSTQQHKFYTTPPVRPNQFGRPPISGQTFTRTGSSPSPKTASSNAVPSDSEDESQGFKAMLKAAVRQRQASIKSRPGDQKQPTNDETDFPLPPPPSSQDQRQPSGILRKPSGPPPPPPPPVVAGKPPIAVTPRMPQSQSLQSFQDLPSHSSNPPMERGPGQPTLSSPTSGRMPQSHSLQSFQGLTLQNTNCPPMPPPKPLPSSQSAPQELKVQPNRKISLPGPPRPSVNHDDHLREVLAKRRAKLERQSSSDDLEDASPASPPPQNILFNGQPLRSVLKKPPTPTPSQDGPTKPPPPQHLFNTSTPVSYSSLQRPKHLPTQPSSQRFQARRLSSPGEEPLEVFVPPPDCFRDQPQPEQSTNGSRVSTGQSTNGSRVSTGQSKGSLYFATGGQRIISSSAPTNQQPNIVYRV